jgi:site-specific DNA recombinase
MKAQAGRGTNGAGERAAIYARVSTDDQRDNYSIPTQLDADVRYCAERGYTIVGDQFVDAVTGRDTVRRAGTIAAYVDDYTSLELSRPSLNNVFTYADAIGFDVLVVHALDRLARDPYIRQTLERELESRGVRVEYVLGNYDDSAEGEVRKDLDSTFAKWENYKRVERSRRGKNGKATSGKWPHGKIPYGYYADIDAPSGLSVDEAQAQVVRRIFYHFVHENMSIRGIADLLTQEGITTAEGKDKWGKSTIQRYLGNETYIGRKHWGKTRRAKSKQVKAEPQDWIPIQVPAVVDEDTYYEAQRKLKENAVISRRKAKRFYLLSGMVFCELCGRVYAAQTNGPMKNSTKRKSEFQSYRHRSKEGHCTNREISAARLEGMVWEQITRVLIDPLNLRTGYEQAYEQERTQHARKEAHLRTLYETVKRLELQSMNLTQAYTDPEIQMTKAEYLSQRTQLQDKIEAAREQIEQTEGELYRISQPIDLETLEDFASQIRKLLANEQDIPQETKRRILDLLRARVFLSLDDSFRLEGWFSFPEPENEGLSSTSSRHYDRPQQQSPEHVWHVLGL